MKKSPDDNSNIQIVSVTQQNFDYHPTDERWQERICLALGWPLVGISCLSSVANADNIHPMRRPKFHCRIKGDGNCWYRTIAFIVTGDEEQYPLIKSAVLNFMLQNLSVIQQILQENSYILDFYRDEIPVFTDNAARQILDYHQIDGQWADNIIIELTSCILKTDIYLYDTRNGWKGIHFTPSPFLRQQQFFVSSSNIEATTNQAIYINHVGRNHFEPSHNGV